MDSIVETINVTCIGNLLILLLFTLYRKPRTIVNVLLSAIIIFPVFAMIFNLLLYFHIIYEYPIAFYLTFPINYLWAPALLFYVRIMTGESIKLKAIDLFHLLPSIASIGYSVFFSMQDKAFQADFFNRIFYNPPLPLRSMNMVLNLQVFLYCFLCFRKVNRFEKTIRSLYSETQNISAQWIKQFVLLYVILNIIAIIPEMLLPDLLGFVILLPITMFISFIYLAYNNATHKRLYDFHIQIEQLYSVSNIDESESPELNKTEIDPNVQLLTQVMITTKCYLNENLSLQTLSDITAIPNHKLSEIINKNWEMNFFDFVNSYRIEYSKQLILDPENNKYTIETIAQMSGFKNRSTFYSAFNKKTGMSPREFKNSHP